MRGIVIRRAVFAKPVKGKKPKIIGFVRELDPDDPRNIHHHSHREAWLELARVLGRMEADREFEEEMARRRKK